MRRRLALSTALAAAALAAVPETAAAVPCDQVPGLTNIVYAQVGDTQSNLMRRLGRGLRDNPGRPISLVWITSGSCNNIAAIYNRTPFTTGATMQYVASLAENAAWTPTTPNLTCEVPAGVILDISNSALFNSACTQSPPPATVRVAEGPKQAYVLAVPEASTQTAITYEEAYFVFGFGMAGGAQPWTDEAQLFIRSVTTSTLLAWAANIGVPADKWKGIRQTGSPIVVAALQNSTSPQAAIGILGAEVYDSLRDTLNVLAFRARGQYAAYYPDSTTTARDKINVRDGHYTVWSPTTWMDTSDGAGTPLKADARYITDLITSRPVTPAPTLFDMNAIIAAVGLVPDCAMKVKRAFEGGPLSLYAPSQSCVCKYESLVGATNTTCQTCTTTCTTGVCRDGFCEVQ